MIFAVSLLNPIKIFDSGHDLMKFKVFGPSIIFLIILFFITGCTDRMPYDFNGKALRYPHSKIVNSMHLKSGCYAELETMDSEKKVSEYYKDRMDKAGWSIKVERKSELSNPTDSKSSTFLAFFKDNTGLMIDTYTPVDGGKTQIALFLGETHE